MCQYNFYYYIEVKNVENCLILLTTKYYYCLLTLDKDTGAFNKCSWSYVYKPTEISSYRMLTISHASERFIYAYGNLFYDSYYFYSFALYLFDPITLKLKLVYGLLQWFNLLPEVF